MGSNKEYLRQYYLKNKERLSEIRKRRYREDIAYRESVKKATKINQALRTIAKAITRDNTILTVYGVKEPFYNLRQLAREIDRDYLIVHKWKRLKFIPEPIYAIKNRKLYSKSQVLYFKDFLKLNDSGMFYLTYEDMRKFLNAVWKLPYKGEEFSISLIKKLTEGGLNES